MILIKNECTSLHSVYFEYEPSTAMDRPLICFYPYALGPELKKQDVKFWWISFHRASSPLRDTVLSLFFTLWKKGFFYITDRLWTGDTAREFVFFALSGDWILNQKHQYKILISYDYMTWGSNGGLVLQGCDALCLAAVVERWSRAIRLRCLGWSKHLRIRGVIEPAFLSRPV